VAGPLLPIIKDEPSVGRAARWAGAEGDESERARGQRDAGGAARDPGGADSRRSVLTLAFSRLMRSMVRSHSDLLNGNPVGLPVFGFMMPSVGVSVPPRRRSCCSMSPRVISHSSPVSTHLMVTISDIRSTL